MASLVPERPIDLALNFAERGEHEAALRYSAALLENDVRAPLRLLVTAWMLGALGDLIHALPAAAAIRRALPQARIEWLVDTRHRELLDLVPVIDRPLDMDGGAVGSIVKMVAGLRRNHYDVALDLQGLLKSAVLARASGAARVIGFPASFLREQGARMFYTETAGSEEDHVVYKNVSMLSALLS